MEVNRFSEKKMNRPIRSALLGLALASALILAGCGATVPVRTMSQGYVTEGTPVATVHEAVLRVAELRYWRVVSDDPGVVTLAYPAGPKAQQFEAIVRVNYDARNFRVEYVSSRGLNEGHNCTKDKDVVCAHRNVNNWMINLDKDIRRFLVLQPRTGSTAPAQAQEPAKTSTK